MDAAPELIPARMLNEFVYCPRLAYLEWVQGEWEENALTREGTYVHRRVDAGAQERGASPEEMVTRSVQISAPEMGLVARLDVLELGGGEAIPVDYKRGKPPDTLERSWPPERIQLCAQALILRENGWICPRGYLYFTEARQRVEVEFDARLEADTRAAIESLRRTLGLNVIPPPLVHSPKCPDCSLVGICLPDEVYLLQSHQPPGEARRLIPQRDDALPLYLQTQGLSVGVSHEVLEIKEHGKKIGEARLIDTSQVCLQGNVQISTQAVRELAFRNIPICYFSYGGWFSAITVGMAHKNVELRRHQYRVAFDLGHSLFLARRIVYAKIRNCRTLLLRNHRDLPLSVPIELKRLALAAQRVPSLETLLGVEGLAGRLYFAHFTGMLKTQDFRFDFEGRNRRPPRDPVNALLSYAYSLLTKDLTVTAYTVGLDPYQGFYHQPRYGRPALALDLMEEFRPLIADSTVLWAINNGVVKPQDFVVSAGVNLRQGARRQFLQAYERRMNEVIRHPWFGYTISYRRILNVQARLLGRHLAGEIDEFPPFLTR